MTDSARIYVYKYADRGSAQGTERIQRSWSYWQLNGASRVLQVLCVMETLYLLVEYPDGGVWLEKMPVADRLSTDALTTTLLDRVVTTTAATPAIARVASGIYDTTTKTTTWTLPYAVAAPTQVWSLYGTAQNGGKLLGSTTSGNTITARGDWAGKDVVFGEAFEFRYRFSRFKLMRDQGGGRVASNVERTQVRHAKLRFHDTSYFKVEVKPERRPLAVYTFDGWQLGVRDSQVGSTLGQGLDIEDRQYFEGVFSIPIQARGESCIVELKNDTANPCMFSGCDWIAQITSRAQALQ